MTQIVPVKIIRETVKFFQGIEIKWCYVVLLGLIVVFAFARIGNNILK